MNAPLFRTKPCGFCLKQKRKHKPNNSSDMKMQQLKITSTLKKPNGNSSMQVKQIHTARTEQELTAIPLEPLNKIGEIPKPQMYVPRDLSEGNDR